MARFEIDSTARPIYPAPDKFWNRVAAGLNWTGLLLLLGLVFGAPIALFLSLLR
jgi:hypothetical protein